MVLEFFSRQTLENAKKADAQSAQAGENPSTPLKQRKTVHQGGLSMKDIALHNKPNDCWLIIDGKVYDVSNWIDKHPGGEILLSYAGMDATDVFDAFHAESTYSLLKGFYIGDVIDQKLSEVTLEHRRLRKKLKQTNFYHASKLYYVYKVLTNLSLVSISAALVMGFESRLVHLLAAFFLALFWQQCGWLSHDFLHHQVFSNRQWNNFMGYILGNVAQGFSVSWWKAKHNLHHAVPNVKNYDPDIDTMPFLAWSEKLIEGELEGLPHILIQYQYIFYLPLLSAARLSWLIQSLLYPLFSPKIRSDFTRKVEVSTLCIHYLWVGLLAFGGLGILEGIAFILLSQAFAGLLLSTAFSLNHNGMVILDPNAQNQMEFSRLQIITARDVRGGPINFFHWFMGGLDMQIEHHLFPTVPRHNLRQVQTEIEAMCKKYNIQYHQTGFWSGTKELFSQLYTVSRTQNETSGNRNMKKAATKMAQDERLKGQ
jgi:cytochrome b involved in lipid metabolism